MAASHDKLSVFPVFLKVENRFAVVVGDGAQAAAKARLLRESCIEIRLVSLAPSGELAALVIQADLVHIPARFSPDHLRGAALVFAATGDETRDTQIVAAANSLNIPVNAVDRPCLCDFYTPALVNRAPIAVAIGSEGSGPVLTQMVRAKIEAILPRSTGNLARLGALYRIAVDRLLPRGLARRSFWAAFFDGEVAKFVEQGNLPMARRAATRLLKNVGPQTGLATLVATGSGEADLLTLRAVRALQETDFVLFEEGLAADLVGMGRRDAERHSFAANTALASLAPALAAQVAAGQRIVVLAAGLQESLAPLAEALAAHKAGFVTIPGVSAGSATAGSQSIAANRNLAA